MINDPASLRAALRNVFGRIWPALRPHRARFAVAFLVVLISISLALVYPQMIRLTIDEGIEGSDSSRLHVYGLVLLGILFLQIPAVYLKTYLFEDIGRKTGLGLLASAHSRLLSQEIAFFDEESVGELNARLTNDVWELVGVVGAWVPATLRASLGGVCGMALMLYTAPFLSLLVVSAGPLVAGFTSVLGRRIQRRQAAAQQAHAYASASSLESLSGIRTVREFDQERAEAGRYQNELEGYNVAATLRTKASALLESLTSFFSEGAIVAGLWAGGMMILSGALTPGELVSFLFYVGLVVQSFKQLSSFGGEVMRADGATRRIFELMERDSELPVGGGVVPKSVSAHIRFENVYFEYRSRPDFGVLEGLDLEIDPGEFVALVGPSGMGKSTIGQLMVRFYDPSSGRILFDGTDIRELDTEWLRNQIVLVPQDSALFTRTIDENVRYGVENATDAEIDEALRVTGAQQFIEELPLGMETVVGERGAAFSGGQRQRIAIARALLRKPRILILDEATSALDAESEAAVKESLRKLHYRPGVVMVAHRLSTVIDADRVIVVQAGRVVADGRHDDLIRDSAEYRSLVQGQLVEG